MDIIFATNNKGKIREVKKLFENSKINIYSLEDLNINIIPEETGETFEENSLLKAKTIMECTNKIVIADDSGLEIDFLNKKPGVYSARFLGENTPYIEKNKQVLEMLKNVPLEKRTARFICSISFCDPNKKILTSKGILEGIIDSKIKGENGFGFDPIFFVSEKNKTLGEMSLEEKSKISHRGKALEIIKEKIFKEYNL